MNSVSSRSVALCCAILLNIAGCGGSGSGSASSLAPAAVPAALPAPVPAPTAPTGADPAPAAAPPRATLATAPFIAAAQSATCAATVNRLFVIDDTLVFAAQADVHCADLSYRQALYGATPDVVLCTASDTIAGPRASCGDAAQRALFDTLRTHLDQPDLGVGSAHTVQEIAFAPAGSDALPTVTVARMTLSALQAPLRQRIVDAAAWATLWRQMQPAATPQPAVPPIDFNTQMLLVVAAGMQTGCREVAVGAVHTEATRVVAEYVDRDVTSASLCLTGVKSPVDVVAVPRSALPVHFVDVGIAPGGVGVQPFTTLAKSPFDTAIVTREQVVVRSSADLAALWARHQPGVTPPAIDFSQQMVIGLFRGGPSPCNTITIDAVTVSGGDLVVHSSENLPGPATLCIAMLGAPFHLIVTARSDAPLYVVTTTRVDGVATPQR